LIRRNFIISVSQ